jgi:hypothetical protein
MATVILQSSELARPGFVRATLPTRAPTVGSADIIRPDAARGEEAIIVARGLASLAQPKIVAQLTAGAGQV